jgi:hypothetical protein
MSFRQQLIITLVDKLAIGALLIFAGYFFNRLLESFRTDQGKLLKAFEAQQTLTLDAFRSKRSFENELAKLRDAKNLEYLERQLSEFYWPIYMRLFVHRAVWEKVSPKQTPRDEVINRIGSAIEANFILPNHEEVVRILQSNIHLAEGNTPAFNLMLRYIRHVAVYKAIREAECHDKMPSDLDEPYPSELLTVIRDTAHRLQNRYDSLIESMNAESTKTTAP